MVPFNQLNVPGEAATDANGWAQLNFQTLAGFPAARRQQLLVMFVRARKPGENLLAGISSRRLVSVRARRHLSRRFRALPFFTCARPTS